MSKRNGIPDAWDDDYEAVADAASATPASTPAPVRTSRAQRKAEHEAENRRLWQSAEQPETFHFVEARSNVLPPTANLKPALKVLSRKPNKPVDSAEQGIRGLNIADDPDSEEEERREQERQLRERQAKAALERAEKQKRYAETRARLFGTAPAASAAAPASTAPEANARQSGTRTRAGRDRRNGASSGSHQGSSADQSPARTAAPALARQLFDPHSADKPGLGPAERPERRRVDDPSIVRPIRSPRGPDGSGRGGFGFASRGGRATKTDA